MITVEMICFGNELLIGKTVNTNAYWLGKRLTALGAQLVRITTVRDVLEEMVAVICEAIRRSPDFIITSGGLGPTFDDMALEAIAKGTKQKLVLSEAALNLIQARLQELKDERGITIPLTENRKKMAMIPEGALCLRNRAGSAPGVLVSKGKIKIFALPGVPREMKTIFDHEVVPYFTANNHSRFYERSFLVNHIPESELAEAISPLRAQYPTIYFKTHPKSTTTSSSKRIIEVEVHLTVIGSEEEEQKILAAEQELLQILRTMPATGEDKPKITSLLNDDNDGNDDNNVGDV